MNLVKLNKILRGWRCNVEFERLEFELIDVQATGVRLLYVCLPEEQNLSEVTEVRNLSLVRRRACGSFQSLQGYGLYSPANPEGKRTWQEEANSQSEGNNTSVSSTGY